MQNKEPRNADKQRHGRWELYYPSGNTWWKANFVNGIEIGFSEYWYRVGPDDNITNNEYYAR